MTFLYPLVKHASYISERRVGSSEVLPVKELLISSSKVKPYSFYQVIEHRAGELVVCIDQQCNTVSLHIDEVRVVNCYE
jgi:hypothetical protein